MSSDPYDYIGDISSNNFTNYFVDTTNNTVSFKLLNSDSITFLDNYVSQVNVTIVGGGGGGGGGGHDNGNSSNPYPKYPSGGGGGAGGAGTYTFVPDSSNTYVYSIGSGGGKGIGNNSGGLGGPTTITSSNNPSFLTATGGGYGHAHFSGNGPSAGGTVTYDASCTQVVLASGGGGGSGVRISNIPGQGTSGTDTTPTNLNIYENNSILIGGGGGGANATDPFTPPAHAGKGGAGGNGNGGIVGTGVYSTGTTDYNGGDGIAPGAGGGGGGQPGPPATNPSKWTAAITYGGRGSDGAIYVWLTLDPTTAKQYYPIYDIPQYTNSFIISPIILDPSIVSVTSTIPSDLFSSIHTDSSNNIIYNDISNNSHPLQHLDESFQIILNVGTNATETINIVVDNPNIYPLYTFPVSTGFDIIFQDNLDITDISLTDISTKITDISYDRYNIMYDISYNSQLDLSSNNKFTTNITTSSKITMIQDISINFMNEIYDTSYDIQAYSQFKITPLTPIISPVQPYVSSSNINVTSLYYDITGNYYKDSFYFFSDNSGVIQEYSYPPVGTQHVYQRIIDNSAGCMWYQIVELSFIRYYNDSYYYNAYDTIDIVPNNLPITNDVTVSSHNRPSFLAIDKTTGIITDISQSIVIVNTFNFNIVFDNSANKLYWNKELELIIMSSGCLWNPDLSEQTDIWSRFSGDCIDLSGAVLTPGVPMTYDDLSEKRKAVIFQYKNNSAGFSKKQHFSRLARGLGKQGKQTYATQNDNYVNPNNKGLKLNNFTLECPGAIKNSGLTTQNDTPGPVRTITNYPNVPLTNYIVQRTYRGGSEKWPQYGPNTGQARNPKFARNTGTKPGYNS